MDIILSPVMEYAFVPPCEQEGFLDFVFGEYEWDARYRWDFGSDSVPRIVYFDEYHEAFEQFVEEITSEDLYDGDSLAYLDLTDDEYEAFREVMWNNYYLFREDVARVLYANHVCFGIFEDDPLYNMPIREVW